jgi:hypothetical protein
MTDFDEALAELRAIRSYVSRAGEFRGCGPASVAASGVLALLVATVQWHSLRALDRNFRAYLVIWMTTAAISVFLVSAEAVARTRRAHSGLGKKMICQAAEQFLPR